MANRRAPSWQLLFLSHPARSAPPLLAWASFSASSYELQLTDLTQVWYEKLSKHRILERAAAENTAIDPAEAPENLATLLEYLQKAITKSVANVESELITAADTDVGGADLRLKIKCELPGGLDDLIWTFELQHGTPVDFANMFVMPMLSRESLRADRIDSLLEKIAERDGVIERLVDYLQDQKTDPKVVVGHRRKKALQKFNQEEWEEEWEGMAGSMRPMEIVKNVFGDGKDINPPLVVQFGYDADQWWKRLDDTSSLRSSMNSRSMSRSFTKTIARTSDVSPARNDDIGVEDSFFTVGFSSALSRDCINSLPDPQDPSEGCSTSSYRKETLTSKIVANGC